MKRYLMAVVLSTVWFFFEWRGNHRPQKPSWQTARYLFLFGFLWPITIPASVVFRVVLNRKIRETGDARTALTELFGEDLTAAVMA